MQATVADIPKLRSEIHELHTLTRESFSALKAHIVAAHTDQIMLEQRILSLEAEMHRRQTTPRHRQRPATVTPANDEEIAGHIDRYFALLQRQLDRTDDWPAAFTFPEPRDSAERKAFEAFILKLRSVNIHIEPVEFTTDPGHA